MRFNDVAGDICLAVPSARWNAGTSKNTVEWCAMANSIMSSAKVLGTGGTRIQGLADIARRVIGCQ